MDNREEVDEDELKIEVEKNSMSPISRKEIVKPMKNIICGHLYDKHNVQSLLKQTPI